MTLYESYQIKFCGHTELAMNIAKCDENCSFFVKDIVDMLEERNIQGKNYPHVPPPSGGKIAIFYAKCHLFYNFLAFWQNFCFLPRGGGAPPAPSRGGGIVPPHENLLAGKPQLICPSLV